MVTHTNAKAHKPESEDARQHLHKSSDGIACDDQGTLIKAKTPLGEIGTNDFVREHYRALAQAAALVAVLQERNSATVGSHVNRWLHRDTLDRTSERSDFMAALLAHNANLQLSGPANQQTLSMDALITQMSENDSRPFAISLDVELAGLHITPQLPGEHSLYLKALNSKVWAFAQVGVAVWLRMEGIIVAETRLVASGITPTLWRLSNAEQMLIGQPLEETRIARAVESVLQEALPSEQNRYKIPLVKGLLHRALNHLAHEL